MRRLKLNVPMKSTRPGKKKMVYVRNPKTGKIVTVHYGAVGYSDYTIHKDEKRRARFRARHKCSEKKDKTKPGYWACSDLWGGR